MNLAAGRQHNPLGDMETNLRLEELAIRVLCLGTPQGSVKEAVIPLLLNYPWQSPLHRVVFKALAAIPSNDPSILRDLLPAKLTRMGFPDLAWETFFAPHSLSRDEALALVRRMLNRT
jgi:hypothetical protein